MTLAETALGKVERPLGSVRRWFCYALAGASSPHRCSLRHLFEFFLTGQFFLEHLLWTHTLLGDGDSLVSNSHLVNKVGTIRAFSRDCSSAFSEMPS